MGLCRNIDTEIRDKVLEINERVGGTALENKDITELLFLIDSRFEALKIDKEFWRNADEKHLKEMGAIDVLFCLFI